eukprot:716660-Pleurochrysis_carterae.AAC.1
MKTFASGGSLRSSALAAARARSLAACFLGFFLQSRCQCLPPQWRQVPNFGFHSSANELGFSRRRFGSR